jgi:hypothetical protein
VDPAPIAVVPFEHIPITKFPVPLARESFAPSRVCAASELVASVVSEPVEKGVRLRLSLTTNGATCAAGNTHRVELRAPDGTVLTTTIDNMGVRTLDKRWPGSPPAIDATRQAVTYGEWTTYCGPRPPAWRARVVFGDGAVDAATSGPLPPCRDGDAPPRLEGSYEHWEILDDKGRHYGFAIDFRMSVSAPAQVRRGEKIPLRVTLSNPTRGDLSLREPCAPYMVGYEPGYTRPVMEDYLNCDAAPAVLPPGRSVVFEIEAPAIERPGTYRVGWGRIDGAGGPDPVTVTVVQ